jgi:hypothetical protein
MAETNVDERAAAVAGYRAKIMEHREIEAK